MKASNALKTYSVEQRLEQFKRENDLKNDADAVIFLLTEISKYAKKETT